MVIKTEDVYFQEKWGTCGMMVRGNSREQGANVEKRHSLMESVVLYMDLKKLMWKCQMRKTFHHPHYAHIYPHLNLYQDVCAYLFFPFSLYI